MTSWLDFLCLRSQSLPESRGPENCLWEYEILLNLYKKEVHSLAYTSSHEFRYLKHKED